METIYLKVLLTLSLFIFLFGVGIILIRKQSAWLLIGQITCFKALTFCSCILLVNYSSKTELFGGLIYSGIFFMIIFSLIGFALLIRSKRFGGSTDLSEVSFLKN